MVLVGPPGAPAESCSVGDAGPVRLEPPARCGGGLSVGGLLLLLLSEDCR